MKSLLYILAALTAVILSLPKLAQRFGSVSGQPETPFPSAPLIAKQPRGDTSIALVN